MPLERGFGAVAGGAEGQFFENAIMILGRSRLLRGGKECGARQARQLAILAVLLGLAACSPVEAWRDLTGVSQNDPDPDTTPNTRNLAAGEAVDYPNLATVPPPPIRAMTAAEREKLTQSLIADRANARHSDERLRAGFSAASAAPPPPPGSPGPEPTTAQSGPAAAPPPPAPGPSAPSVSSAPPAPSIAPAPSGAVVDWPGAPSGTAAPRGRLAGKASVASGQGPRKQGESPEPGPMESSLEMPQARAAPQPEEVQPAPPPPQLPPTPRVAATLPSGLAPGGALTRTPLPEAPGSAAVQPPPAPPELPPLQPTRAAAAEAGKGKSKPTPTVGTPVAEVKFGTDSTSLTESDRKTLATIVPLYEQNPGKVRIVGYAVAGSGAVDQLNSYRTALDRAQAVAAALTQAGIPSEKIQVEAAPAVANSAESRAEVSLEH